MEITMPLLFAFLLFVQTADLTLNVHRNVGYSAGSQIQGSFHLEVLSTAQLTAVTFKLDGDTIIGTASASPFALDFRTDDYPPGLHALTAEAQTADGRTLVSPERRFEFITAEQGNEAAFRLIGPILGVVGLVLLLVFGSQLFIVMRGKTANMPLGEPRAYGFFGGTICPNCQHAFSRHWWALNMVVGKLDRCDHCGKWNIVQAVGIDRFNAAIAAEREQAQPTTPPAERSADDKLRKQLDDSRYSE
jgi:hypothetical protein